MVSLSKLKKIHEIYKTYSTAYKNWPWVLTRLVLTGSARAITRDGRALRGNSIIIGSMARLYEFCVSSRRCEISEISDDASHIIIKVEGKELVIYGWYHVNFVADIDEYSFLDVHNKSVLDVGAFVGDSAMLFALRGARRVVAVEPSPWAYKMAEKNVEVNGLSDVITLVNCAVSREDGKILKLPSGEINTGFRALAAAKGDVPVFACTLDSLIEKYGPFDVVKVDCEGCEHESIPYSRRIGEVREVLVEYHDGYEDIVRKLREDGFDIIKYPVISRGNIKFYEEARDPRLGYIYSVRNKKLQ